MAAGGMSLRLPTRMVLISPLATNLAVVRKEMPARMENSLRLSRWFRLSINYLQQFLDTLLECRLPVLFAQPEPRPILRLCSARFSRPRPDDYKAWSRLAKLDGVLLQSDRRHLRHSLLWAVLTEYALNFVAYSWHLY